MFIKLFASQNILTTVDDWSYVIDFFSTILYKRYILYFTSKFICVSDSVSFKTEQNLAGETQVAHAVACEGAGTNNYARCRN